MVVTQCIVGQHCCRPSCCTLAPIYRLKHHVGYAYAPGWHMWQHTFAQLNAMHPSLQTELFDLCALLSADVVAYGTIWS